jgi:D-sedoheptulose 7-phosphate isomerase
MSAPDFDTELLEHARRHFAASAETKRRFAEEHAQDLVTAARWLAECFASGGKLLLCGNGGSAAEAQHIAAEFTSVLSQDFPRKALPAISLTTDSSFLSARGNDYGFDSVFARQVEALGRAGDVLFAYSTSGNSKNVVAGVETARGLGIRTVGFLGGSGGKLKTMVDLALTAPHDKTMVIQECHTSMGHMIVAIAEKYLFNPDCSERAFSR